MMVQFYIPFPLPLQFLLRLTVSVDVLGLQSWLQDLISLKILY